VNTFIGELLMELTLKTTFVVLAAFKSMLSGILAVLDLGEMAPCTADAMRERTPMDAQPFVDHRWIYGIAGGIKGANNYNQN
jgi:hypothetical protein